MTYSPGSPGGSGYPAQGSGSYGAPAQFGPQAEPGPSKLPLYLSVAVVALGLIGYLLTFGPMFTLNSDLGPFGGELSIGATGTSTLVVVGAALLAAVGLLPKAKDYHAIVAVLAVLGLLLTISQLIGKPDGFSIGWAFWVFLAVVLLQTVAAIGALLLDSGVITPPAPRPKYEQQYGQYGAPGGYYGAPSQPAQGQRPGYPSQYGGYPQQGPAGGYGAPGAPGTPGAPGQAAAPQGPPTPPTGYPSFSPPPAVGPGGPVSPSAPTQQAQTPPPSGGPATP